MVLVNCIGLKKARLPVFGIRIMGSDGILFEWSRFAQPGTVSALAGFQQAVYPRHP
jgi:hypothetical protein